MVSYIKIMISRSTTNKTTN